MGFYIVSRENGGTYPMDAIEVSDAFAWLNRFRCVKCVKRTYNDSADPDFCDGIITRKTEGWKCSRYRCEVGWKR